MSNQNARMEVSIVSWHWYERLVLFCIGIGLGGWLFCFVLPVALTPSSRPVFTQPELGYTHLIQVGHSRDTVYVTYFEYLASTYGVFATLGFAVISGLCGYLLGISAKSRSSSGKIQVNCACAATLILSYLAWSEKFLQ